MTEETTPEPLVPADVDLRGFPGFVLDVDRLLASELVALGEPAACWAALMLWVRAWKQSPPASLPDNDAILAAYSGAGRNWKKVKDTALRGFVKCSDGRLYHKVLAEEANKSWERRQKFKERSAKANEGRWAPARKPSSIQQGSDQGYQQGETQGHLQGLLEAPRKDSLAPPVEVKEKRSLKESKKENDDVKVPDSVPREAYAFESGIIRLNQKDFDQWKLAFSHLDLAAELLSLTKWAGEQGKNWFFAISGALAKRNREVGIKIEQAKNGQGAPTFEQQHDPRL